MSVPTVVDTTAPSRELIRTLRRGSVYNGTNPADEPSLPESVAWQAFLELRRRDEPQAGELFLKALRRLHSQRSLAGSEMPIVDTLTDEHRLSQDQFLGELWKAYKKCIRNNRTGPASLLLRDIEEQLQKAN